MRNRNFGSLILIALVSIFAFGFCRQFQKNTGITQIQGVMAQNPNGVIVNQVDVPISDQWELIQFENEAIEVDGKLYDKGWFKNVSTGEVIEARCLDPTATDPIEGDRFFFNSEGKLEKFGGNSQKFEKTFQIIPTPTLVFPTAISTTIANQGIISEPDSGTQVKIPFNWLPLICLTGIAVAVLAVGYLRYRNTRK